MAHTCRGTINLAGSFIDTMNATDFVITNGPSQVYHLRALNEVERQRWVTALELAKAKAIKNLESGQLVFPDTFTFVFVRVCGLPSKSKPTIVVCMTVLCAIGPCNRPLHVVL